MMNQKKMINDSVDSVQASMDRPDQGREAEGTLEVGIVRSPH